MSRPQPPRQPPPVQRLRLRYAKRGPARFASHRDVARALERALRRAGIPMAYSSGFSPHPRISYAGATPTGAASEAEYVELALAEAVDTAALVARLASVMPEGLVPLAAVEAPPGVPLHKLLQASRWFLELVDAPQAAVQQAVDELGAADGLIIHRRSTSGSRALDVRPALLDLRTHLPHGVAFTIRLTEPLVRPNDVAAALGVLQPSLADVVVLPTRLEQGPLLADGTIGDPLSTS